MKLRNNNRIVHAVAAVALAGFSLSSAFAAQPTYTLPSNTPLDATDLNSSSAILSNFNDYLIKIEDQLGVPTLATGGTAPTEEEFLAAVSEAVGLLANAGNEYGIIQAAVAYSPKLMKKILTRVVTENPTAAEAAVGAAAAVVPKKAGDAAGSVIAGLIAAGGATGDYNIFFDAADDAVIDQTITLIEKVAEGAVKAVKKASPASAPQATAEAIGAAIVTAVLNSTVTKAELYLDAVGRGVIGSVKGEDAGASKGNIATAMLNAFYAGPVALTTKENAVALSLGILKKSGLAAGDFIPVRNTITGLAATPPEHDAAILSAAHAMEKVRNGTIVDQTSFQSALDGTEASEAAAFVFGAGQEAPAGAADYVQWALTDTHFTAIDTPATQQAVVAAGVAANFSAAAKVVKAAIEGGGLSAVDAVTAAIPAGRDLYAGKAVTAAYKAAPPATAVASKAILTAAINAATAAGYQRALLEVSVAAAKADKLNASPLVEAALAAAPDGWEEAVAAAIVAVNPGTKSAADAFAAIPANNVLDPAGVALATNVAATGKANKAILFDEALTVFIAQPTKARAILLGAGAVNAKLTIPLLGAALKFNSGTDTDAALLNYAIALNKNAEAGIRLGYEAAIDARDNEDNIFDITDHKLLLHPKNAVDIIQGIVSVRPEYAHYAAHAAGYRASKYAGKIGTALIQFAHMRVVNNDDPAAVAAISAGLTTGILEANLGTKEESSIKAAVAGLIKGSLAFPDQAVPVLPSGDVKSGLIGSSNTFQQANGDFDTVAGGGVTPAYSKGTAGVVTGAVAQTQRSGAASGNLSTLSAVVINAAAKVAKSKNQLLAIAQAAAQAAYFVGQFLGNTPFGDVGDVAAIVAAFPSGGKANPTQLANAVKIGLELAASGVVGAGAAGLTDTATKYQHHSGVGLPVTSEVNL